MRCTNCSTKIKPVVAIDIDGTLGDFHSHFLKFVAGYLGREPWESYGHLEDADNLHPRIVPINYDSSMPFKQWTRAVFDIADESTWYDIKLAYRQGGLKRTMPAINGAADLTKYVRRDLGAELWLTTTRPYNRLDNIDPDTREFCRRHGIEYDYLLYDEDKYQILAQRVDKDRVVAVLDDLYEQCDEARGLFGPHVPLQMVSEWNKSSGWDGFVVSDLVIEAKRDIARRVRMWNRITRELM